MTEFGIALKEEEWRIVMKALRYRNEARDIKARVSYGLYVKEKEYTEQTLATRIINKIKLSITE